MKFPLDPATIASCLQVKTENVEKYWPDVEICLESLDIAGRMIASKLSKIGALATIRVETMTFEPRHELGGTDYLNRKYDERTDLGNTPEDDGDGAKYAGRGLIQITGRSNYESYGKKLGIDLVADPELAMQPHVSASIFAAYWTERRIDMAAAAQDWRLVRKLVNGGYNGLPDFLSYVDRLIGATNR
jgi:predicted chitinase